MQLSCILFPFGIYLGDLFIDFGRVWSRQTFCSQTMWSKNNKEKESWNKLNSTDLQHTCTFRFTLESGLIILFECLHIKHTAHYVPKEERFRSACAWIQ